MIYGDDNIHDALEKVAAPRYIKNIAKGKVTTKEPFLQSLADARNFGKSQRKLPPANSGLPANKRRAPFFVGVTGHRTNPASYGRSLSSDSSKRSKRMQELAAKYRIDAREGVVPGRRETRPDVFTAKYDMTPKEHVRWERSQWKARSPEYVKGQGNHPLLVKIKKMRGKEISRREKLVGLRK